VLLILQLLKALETELEEITKSVLSNYKKSSYEFKVTEQYRNMKDVLDTCYFVVENALEAIKRTGVKPVLSSIRGGTDGSRLSFMGLPCPNIYAGEHAFHSKLEWVSVQDMEKATQTIVHLAADLGRKCKIVDYNLNNTAKIILSSDLTKSGFQSAGN
jgi:tripeptide aminopeptidase